MRGALQLVSLLRSQWASPERVRRRQDEALRRLVRHAFDTVPYYRDLFRDAGLDPAEVRGVADLEKIPLTTKRDLQEQSPERLISSTADPRRLKSSRTSGATGEPLEIRFGPADRSAMNASFLRAHLGRTLKPRHRLLYFEAREQQGVRQWYERLGIFRRRVLATGDPPEAWIEQTRAWQPHLLQGYALTLKLFARAVRKQGITDLHIPLIASTSGTLDAPGRELLATTFGAEVVDVYASEEAGSVIAWECPVCPGYHVSADTVILESLKNGAPRPPGLEGELYITNLTSYAMPFIRYQQGDVGTLSPERPTCGRGLPLLREIRGRSGDYVVLPGGEVLSPHPFFLILDHADGVGEWKLVQQDLHHVEVQVRAAGGMAPPDLDGITAALQRLLGDEVHVQVALADSVRRSPEQKLRSVVSRLALPGEAAAGEQAEGPDLFGRRQLDELQPLSLDRTMPGPDDARRILQRCAGGEVPALAEVNLLLNGIHSPDFDELKRLVLETSTVLRQSTFGDAVVPMAPVEASNACASNCGFCGWRSSNFAMPRMQISADLIMEQVRYLVGKGIHYIEFVGGDDFRFVRTLLPELVQRTRKLGDSLGLQLKVCFCTMAMTGAQYRELKELGADAMIVWQETYDRRCYERQIISGPKAWGIDDQWKILTGGDGFAFRLGAQERALKAGLEVALGTILGLNDNLNFEVLATIAHARRLMERFPVTPQSPLVIGMPTWNEITTPATDNRPAGRTRINPFFSYIAALYFLALPGGRAWVFPNCRVGIDEQVEAVRAAGVFTSTEVKLGPGGYLPALLAERRAKGEDTVELERVIEAELGMSAADLGAFDRDLSIKEQFVHHYHSHDTYRERMERAGLRLLASSTL